MQIKRFSFILLLAALPMSAARAAPKADYARPLQSAYALLDKSDYAHAYQAFMRHGDRNPLAQFSVGLFYQNGWGRPVDKNIACAWFAKAAKGKIPTALHYTGDCLMRAPDQAGNAAAALSDYLAAADNGHKISLCSAGDFYIRGRYVAKDVPRGLALCTEAAMAGSPPAMLLLGNYLREDPDVPHDLPAARHWYQLAAERNVADARYRLAIMQAQGEGGDADVESALQTMEELAGAGYAPAYLPTAVLYAHLPPDQDTGAPSAEHLAKIYLWASAAKARLTDPDLLSQAGQLQTEVLAVMPPQWRAGLDAKIVAHLAKYAG